MKNCTSCSTENVDSAVSCKKCGGGFFYLRQPRAGRSNQNLLADGIRGFFSSQQVRLLTGVCLLALAAATGGRVYRLHSLAAQLASERAQMSADHTAADSQQEQTTEAQLSKSEAEVQSHLTNAAWLSGTLARARHEPEWQLRLKHDPRIAETVMETNLLQMESLGLDAALTAQAALEKVAELAAPSGSRIEVDPDGDGFRVRVAFMMSRLNREEAGAVTKYQTTGEMRLATRRLDARVLSDLYDYCGTRGITSIAVTCDHTMRQSVIPANATELEKAQLLADSPTRPARLYRVKLEAGQAREIPDWRKSPYGRVMALWRVEYDGFKILTISHDLEPTQDQVDPAGDLEF